MDARRVAPLGFFILAMCMGCGSTQEQRPVAVDTVAERVALLEVDRAFAALSDSVGYIEAYYRFSADQVLLLPPNQHPIRGREEIYRSDLERGLQGHLTWESQDGGVASSGEMGWTWGRWTFGSGDEAGSPQVGYGKYLFLWGKVDGEWKMFVNAWNDDPETGGP